MELNTLTQGDCLELIKELPDGSVDGIITDPPYSLGVTHNGQKGSYSDLVIMKPFFSSLFYQFKRVLKRDGCLYLCCDWRTYPFMYPILDEYLKIDNLLVWDKLHGRVQPFYWYSHELIIFHGRVKKMDISMKSIFGVKGFGSGAQETNGAPVHPTQKPVELFEKFILDSTEEGGVVLDAFAGSGTLAVAAIKTKRNYICFELQDKYVKIATERIEARKGNLCPDIENYSMERNLFTGRG
jgi:site-specific DNA-methyltransferase (adenine-specific)